jgi:hypothetical protein
VLGEHPAEHRGPRLGLDQPPRSLGQARRRLSQAPWAKRGTVLDGRDGFEAFAPREKHDPRLAGEALRFDKAPIFGGSRLEPGFECRCVDQVERARRLPAIGLNECGEIGHWERLATIGDAAKQMITGGVFRCIRGKGGEVSLSQQKGAMMISTIRLAAPMALLLSGAALAQGQQDFTLKNGTGYTISEVYVAPTKSNDWEEDVLGRDVLPHGEEVEIVFSPSENVCYYDIRIVWDDDAEADWRQFNLCEVSRITLYYNHGTNETTAEYE